ncbi:PucR family transcriptional regulator [Paenibacillus sp. HB172176]|uniref:PucR family transcriptional regulator n=1 Tax=Paenibacillus sp. HB172176 TaxID=2493690 RepID=UPI00143902B6|nr:PucR family transcriptional regulator [Paenibacillus sp. HB172176]
MINDTLSFSCRNLLLIPHLQGSVILAGHKGMGRSVTRVNVMEVPDVIDYVREGEFLITSGFPFRDRPEQLAEIIPELAERGVAAIGIKTKRYIERIPETVIRKADEFDIPLIELPVRTSFSDVVREVMENVLVQEARQLSLLQFRYQKLSQKLLQGSGIDDFLSELDDMLLNPVVLMDGSDQLYFSPSAKEALPWPEDSPERIRLVHDIQLGVNYMLLGERRIRVYISKETGRNADCSMLLLEWNQALADADMLTLDRIGALVSLELANVHVRREVESKYVDQFLQDWLNGRIMTRQDLHARAEACGCWIPEGSKFCVAYLKRSECKGGEKPLLQAIQHFRRLGSGREGIYATLLGGCIVLLLAHDSPDHLGRQLEKCRYRLETIRSTEEKVDFSFCMSDSEENPMRVGLQCEQARKIHTISVVCDISDSLISYNQLGIYQLLYLLPDSEPVTEFLDRLVKPLLEYDNKHNTLLFKTLQCYICHNENVKLTAEALFAHYNTVLYRIERAYSLLELDPERVNDRLQLYIAIKLYEMRDS